MNDDCTDGLIDLRQLVELARVIDYEHHDLSQHQYRCFLEFFRTRETVTEREVLIGVAFAYSWMPKIPTIHRTAFPSAVTAVGRAWGGGILEIDELTVLKGVVNNSVVGSSKLLHFVSPELHPILDSHVFEFLHDKVDTRIEKPQYYARYAERCRKVVNQPEFKGLHAIVSEKTGYNTIGFEPPKLRALELTMYYAGKVGYRNRCVPNC